MTRIAILSLAVFVLFGPLATGQELPKAKGAASQTSKGVEKSNPATIARLIAQLESTDFRTRDNASMELSKLEQVPDALREAVKSGDAEVAMRAVAAIKRIDARAFEMAFRDPKSVLFDRLVERLAQVKEFAAEDKQWEIVRAIATVVAIEATRLGKRPFEFLVEDMSKRRRVLVPDETMPLRLNQAIVISAGNLRRVASVTNSIVFVDGDLIGPTKIENSLFIVRGNISQVSVISKSVVLATGYLNDRTSCKESFLQVGNWWLQLADAKDSVFTQCILKAPESSTNRLLDSRKGPLDLLAFSPRLRDDDLSWSREENGLKIAITPGDRPDQFRILWRNPGKEAVELPIERLNMNGWRPDRDDLLNRVFLTDSSGSLVASRRYDPPSGSSGPLRVGRTITLGPGKTYEETIDLWKYVSKPITAGRFQLSIAVEIPSDRKTVKSEFKMWSGSMKSNTIETMIGK